MTQTLLIGKDRFVAVDGANGAPPALTPQAEWFKVGTRATIDAKVAVEVVALFDDGGKFAVVKKAGETKRSPYRVVDFDDLRPVETASAKS